MHPKTLRGLRAATALSLTTVVLTLGAPALADDDGNDRTEDTTRKPKRTIDVDSPEDGKDGGKDEPKRDEDKRERRAEASEPSGRDGESSDAPDAKAKEKPGDSDHEQMVGHVAVGWYGVSDVPVGLTQNGVAFVSAPAVGVRYWLKSRIGIDAALGMSFGSTSVETTAGATSTTTDVPTPYGVLIHGGVPIAVTTVKHAAILVTPEFNLGFGGSTAPGDASIPNDPETKNSGLVFQLGARAGAEVHFGFIGLPNLSLEGSLGLYLNHVSASQEKGDTSGSISQTGFATTALNNPWDFFRSSVAARYYF